MKKFAANYLISEEGLWLKNGMVFLDENGAIVEMVDTRGEFREIAQLTFLNGILLGNFKYKLSNSSEIQTNRSEERSAIFHLISNKSEITISDFIGYCARISKEYPESIIPEVFAAVHSEITESYGFSKQVLPGLYLLSGVDLKDLVFRNEFKLKKIV